MAIITYLSTITLNVNELNATIKGHRVAEWIQEKKKTCTYAASKRPTSGRKKHRPNVKGWRRYFLQMETKQKRLG